jgi:hypothetical protein
MWGQVKDALHAHIDQVAKGKGLAEDATRLKQLNGEYSKLLGLETLAESQATRAARNTPSLGERFGALGKGAAIVGGLASGHGLATAAAYGAYKGAPIVGRAATRALAELARASRAGSVPAELVQRALESGVPRATIEATVSALSPRMEPQEAVQ